MHPRAPIRYRLLIKTSQAHPDDSRTDEQLVHAINSGDETAFTILYYRYRDWTVKLAHRFTNNEADALDVLQETFAYLLRKVPHLHLSGRLTTLLYPVVKNLSIAANRKRRRTASASDDLLDHVPSPTSSDPTQHELTALLASISQSQREVLLLRFVHDLALDEIAAALDIPLGTVKSRLHNALATLRSDPRTRRFFDR